MRIFFYLPTPGEMTGAPRRLLTLACGIRDLGATPIIATEPDTPLMAAAREAGIEAVPLRPVGVLAMREGALFGGGMFFRARVAAALVIQQLRFRQSVRAARADVVWVRGSKSIAFASLGVLLSRRPLIWDVDYDLPSRGFVRLLHRAGLVLARRVVFQHDAATDIFGDKLAQRHDVKLRVITPGIDLRALLAARACRGSETRNEHSPFRILQVGTLCDRKNQVLLVEILRRLPLQILKRVELSFVGGTHGAAYERMLRDQVAARGLTGNVRFLGWRNDVHTLMLQSDLLVMPSKDEGVPNTVQEAMALGLPVLASDAGGIPEVLEHGRTGWVLATDDPETWAATLTRIIEEPHSLSAVSANAQAHAEKNFCTKTWCVRYLEVIHEVGFGEHD